MSLMHGCANAWPGFPDGRMNQCARAEKKVACELVLAWLVAVVAMRTRGTDGLCAGNPCHDAEAA